MPTSSVWRCVIRELRIHIALPVWVTWAEKGQTRRELTCTLDVSLSGARLASVKGLQEPGQSIKVRRKTSEARFRVVWIGPLRTPYEGQVGVECVDSDKTIWDIDFADVHEDFEPIEGASPGATRISASSPTAATTKDRSYACFGTARVWADESNSNCIVGRVTAIGWSGIELNLDGRELLSKDELLLQVQIDEAYLTFKGAVREHSCAWIDFRHIRRGDRRILRALIARLSAREGNTPESQRIGQP